MAAPAERHPRPWTSALFTPIDGASLALFRILFGALLTWDVGRYLLLGRVERYYAASGFRFSYFGFDWVSPLPAAAMNVVFVALTALAICIAVGLRYRTCAALFAVGYTYVFLIDQANYLNHQYLICLLSFLLAFMPAHAVFSFDSQRSSDRAPVVRRWTVWLLRTQVGIVYAYAGIAKLNPDWLAGEPMRSWLAERGTTPVVGPLLEHELATWFFSWGGLLFDLLVVPFLLWRRTRIFAFGFAVAFHVMNWIMFSIGVFPWLMVAATTVFFDPDWPRRWAGRAAAVPADADGPGRRARRVAVTCLATWVALQLLVPLRHWLYPSDVAWSEEGHRFSWRMKLRSKNGTATFVVYDPTTGSIRIVDPADELTSRQADEMSTRPDMILQYAQHLGRRLRAEPGNDSIQIRARVLTSLNGRPHRPLIDPDVDLSRCERGILTAPWILPLDR